MSDSLWPRGLQQARLPCPSLSPGVCSNSCSLSRWCQPTLSSSVIPFSSCSQSFPASVFSNESALHIRWPKYWSFSFSISPSNEYSGLISFGIHWFDLLAVQGILKSLLQHYSSKAKNEFCNLLSVCFYQLYYIYISGLLDALILRHLPRRGQFIMNDISIVMSCEDRIPKGTLLDSEYLSLKDLP